MPLPCKLQEQYLMRFDALIEKGEAIHNAMTTAPGQVRIFSPSGGVRRDPDINVVDWSNFVEWKTNCIVILGQIVAKSEPLSKIADAFQSIKNTRSSLEWGIATMKAVKDNLRNGFIGDLRLQVETELASDYMGQAEQLLNEGQTGKYDHVPAAVLAGAVLEKALRTLCCQQEPQISILKHDGEKKTLNPLIDDLKKSCIFNEAKAKQLKAWAAIRNHAAHGEFDQFTRTDVEQMITGINNFLADYM